MRNTDRFVLGLCLLVLLNISTPTTLPITILFTVAILWVLPYTAVALLGVVAELLGISQDTE